MLVRWLYLRRPWLRLSHCSRKKAVGSDQAPEREQVLPPRQVPPSAVASAARGLGPAPAGVVVRCLLAAGLTMSTRTVDACAGALPLPPTPQPESDRVVEPRSSRPCRHLEQVRSPTAPGKRQEDPRPNLHVSGVVRRRRLGVRSTRHAPWSSADAVLPPPRRQARRGTQGSRCPAAKGPRRRAKLPPSAAPARV